MPKENTANRALERPDQSLTTLFSRLTDDLTELLDAKLRALKNGVEGGDELLCGLGFVDRGWGGYRSNWLCPSQCRDRILRLYAIRVAQT